MFQHLARKRFGQHFLTDAGIIGAIVQDIAPKTGDWLVEIGPGVGALTLPLLAQLQQEPHLQLGQSGVSLQPPANAAIPQLTIIELDRDLAAHWRTYAMPLGGALRVVEADVLNVNFGQLYAEFAALRVGSPAPQRLRVVGNLPYNISSPILFHLLEQRYCIADQHFMLQKEVIERMVASANSAEYGRLSVMLQAVYDLQELLFVPPEAFDPPPRVDSAVVRMVPKALTAHQAAVEAALPTLSALVKVAFSQRRKILRHTLAPWLLERGYTAPFNAQRRAQELEVAEFIDLALAVQALAHVSS